MAIPLRRNRIIAAKRDRCSVLLSLPRNQKDAPAKPENPRGGSIQASWKSSTKLSSLFAKLTMAIPLRRNFAVFSCR